MRDNILKFIHNRPRWIENEGYWRIILSIRVAVILLAAGFSAFCIAVMISNQSFEVLPYLVFAWAFVAAVYYGMNALSLFISWINEGFKTEN